jgi:replicative DNA helicase
MIEPVKVLPNSKRAEDSVLGAIIIEPKSISEVDLHYDMFYYEEHREIFKAILALKTNKSQIDLITITNELRKNNTLDLIGGAYYISQLGGNVISSVHIKTHVSIIKGCWILREQIRLGYELVKRGFDELDSTVEVPKIISELNTTLSCIVQGNEKNTKKMNEELIEHIKNVSKGIG